MSRKLVWRTQPDQRLFEVFSRRRLRLCTTNEAAARAEFAKHRSAVLLTLDEYRAKLPHLGHIYRVVVAEERRPA